MMITIMKTMMMMKKRRRKNWKYLSIRSHSSRTSQTLILTKILTIKRKSKILKKRRKTMMKMKTRKIMMTVVLTSQEPTNLNLRRKIENWRALKTESRQR